MKIRILVLVILFGSLVLISSPACAQERQVGFGLQGKFYGSGAGVDNPTKGAFVDVFVPFQPDSRFRAVTIHGRLSHDRFDSGYDGSDYAFENKVWNYRADARYPFQWKGFDLFVSGGFDAKRVEAETYQFSPSGINEIKYEINYFSPTVGAGINFNNKIVGHYFYALSDFTSGVRERGHHARIDGFIPITDNFNFRAGIEVSKLYNNTSAVLTNTELSVGFARKF